LLDAEAECHALGLSSLPLGGGIDPNKEIVPIVASDLNTKATIDNIGSRSNLQLAGVNG
jgi:hypothetical protein